MCELDRQSLLQILLQELTASMRLRSEPEHLYTAAAIAGFGAVAWGVASLPMKGQHPSYPLWAAAAGIAVTAWAIIRKIEREHDAYVSFNSARLEVMRHLSELPEARQFIPEIMLREVGSQIEASRQASGHNSSIRLVCLAAFSAMLFCVIRIYS